MAPNMDLIVETLREKFRLEMPVTPETRLEDLGLDSLDQISFLYTLEEKSGVKIPDEDLDKHNLERLGQIAEHIERLRGA
jgi:acyl carrier protein